MCGTIPVDNPEVLLAKLMREDLGIDINPQALRMFVRSRWARVSALAHTIHEPAPKTLLERAQADVQRCPHGISNYRFCSACNPD